MDTILAFVDICKTAFKVLVISPEKYLYGYFLHSFNMEEIRWLMWKLLVLDWPRLVLEIGSADLRSLFL